MANSLVRHSDEEYPIRSPEHRVALNEKVYGHLNILFYFLIFDNLRFYHQKVNLNSINIVIIFKINF